MEVVGKSVIRKEAFDKVTGRARYTHDYQTSGMLSAKMVISPYGHAKIVSIDTSKARQVPGVRAIIAGKRYPLTGEAIRDRPPIAVDKVRYHGEPVALVVADTPGQAKTAADLIHVQYEPLPVVNSPTQAFRRDAPLVHKQLGEYKKEEDSHPVPGTNIATHIKIRKGNMEKGWAESEVVVEASFSFAPSDHAAMETRCSTHILTPPCHICLDATVKLDADRNGKLKAAEIQYLWDGGAYSDKAIDVTRSGAVDCTVPYKLVHVWCDSYCMYTNHPYAAPFRGFSHSELSFAIERTMDILAGKLNMDPLELRHINAIQPGDTTPTRVLLNRSNIGDLRKCIEKLRDLFNWNKGPVKEINKRYVRVKGISWSWKTSTIDPDAPSGVILTFNRDGSINLMSRVIEIGTGTKTVLAQILAERLKMDVDKIHVRMEVDTQTTPEHWKTVASRGTYMGGRTVLEAAEDVIRQLKEIAACVLRAPIQDLEVGGSLVYLRYDPAIGLHLKDISYGYQYPNGNAIGGQIIGKGNIVLRHLSHLDPETGAGKPGPEWTPAAYGVEIEFDRRDYTYRLVKACTVVDIGKVMNEKAALGQVMGAMSMGLAFAGRETFYFDELGRVLNPQLRTYRPLRYGENPEFLVGFVETPALDSAYGARGVGEHGVMGMPGALGNALSLAAGVSLHHLPLIPELVWKAKEAARNASI